jgi:hypothetical protein
MGQVSSIGTGRIIESFSPMRLRLHVLVLFIPSPWEEIIVSDLDFHGLERSKMAAREFGPR